MAPLQRSIIRSPLQLVPTVCGVDAGADAAGEGNFEQAPVNGTL